MFYSYNNKNNITSIISSHSLGLNMCTNSRNDEVIDWWKDKLELSPGCDFGMFTSPITCLALEDIEHRYLLSGANNGNILIHDLYNFTGTPQHSASVVATVDRESQPGHSSTVAEVSWYPLDTGLFLSSGFNCHLHVWDTNRMVESETFQFRHKLICHAMSPVATTHSLIAVGGEEAAVTLCDLRSGCNTHQLRGHAAASVDTCRWSPAHQHLLATGGRDKMILFWDVRYAKSQLASLSRGERREAAHRAPVAGLRFLGDGRHLVSVGRDGAAALWDLLTGRPRWLAVPPLRLNNATGLGCQLAVTAGGRRQLAFLPCGGQVVSVDLAAGGVCQRLDGHLRAVLTCEYDRRCGRLLTAAADGSLLVWAAGRAPPAEAAAGAPGQPPPAPDDFMQDEWSDED